MPTIEERERFAADVFNDPGPICESCKGRPCICNGYPHRKAGHPSESDLEVAARRARVNAFSQRLAQAVLAEDAAGSVEVTLGEPMCPGFIDPQRTELLAPTGQIIRKGDWPGQPEILPARTHEADNHGVCVIESGAGWPTITLPPEPFNKLSAAEAERLALLMEECGEVIQAAGKILRHGYESRHAEGKDHGHSNREILQRELGDVRAALALMVKAGDVHDLTVTIHANEKRDRLLHNIGYLVHHQTAADLSP